MGRAAAKDDDAMRRTLQADGWTQQKLGEAMGYPEASARKSVSQFLKSRALVAP